MMLPQVLRALNNWFPSSVVAGRFSIEGGSLHVPGLQPGQWFGIQGSVFNDGIYQCAEKGLVDEEFDGYVWLLAIPREVFDLADEIAAWCAENEPSALQSESFGGYSYSKSADEHGAPVGWRSVFAKQLGRFRKL